MKLALLFSLVAVALSLFAVTMSVRNRKPRQEPVRSDGRDGESSVISSSDSAHCGDGGDGGSCGGGD